MKVSRTLSYAINALLQLAECKDHRPTPCSRLAREGGIPERFLLQILRELVNKGILQSVRGVDGGYRLAKPPGEVTLNEVMEAVEGPLTPEEASESEADNERLTRLLQVYRQAASVMRDELNKVTLLDLKQSPADSHADSA